MTFRVRPATPSDSASICELFTRVFGRRMSEAEWRWKYLDNPDGWAAVVAESEGRLVGHFGGWPFRALIAGRETIVYSLVDVATLPEARSLGGRRPVLVAMAEALFEILGPTGTPFGFGFPSPRHLKIGESLIGYREHFPVRELRFELASTPASPRIEVRTGEIADEAFDPLWKASVSVLNQACLVRDRRRVNWRYHARPDRYYRMVTLAGAGEDVAWGVLGVTGEQALVMDYLARPPLEEIFRDLVRALEAEARAMGARRLVFWEPPGGPFRGPLRRLLDVAGPNSCVVDAGFSFVTAKIFEEEALRKFLAGLHFTPGFYDDR